MHVEWFTWSLILLVILGIVRYRLKSHEIKRDMLGGSPWTSLLGLTEPLFVPAYWSPLALFDLARNTGLTLKVLSSRLR